MYRRISNSRSSDPWRITFVGGGPPRFANRATCYTTRPIGLLRAVIISVWRIRRQLFGGAQTHTDGRTNRQTITRS